MRTATELARAKAARAALPMEVDGELQVDAALDPHVAENKNVAGAVGGRPMSSSFPTLRAPISVQACASAGRCEYVRPDHHRAQPPPPRSVAAPARTTSSARPPSSAARRSTAACCMARPRNSRANSCLRSSVFGLQSTCLMPNPTHSTSRRCRSSPSRRTSSRSAFLSPPRA